MTRDELAEAAKKELLTGQHMNEFYAAIAAIETTLGIDITAIAEGRAVVVPCEPTEAMKQAFQWGSVLPGELVAGTNAEVYRAMLAAREG